LETENKEEERCNKLDRRERSCFSITTKKHIQLNEKNISISQSPVTAKKMSQLIDSISSGVISGRTAKEVFEIMKESGEEPNKIIESKGLQQKSDPKELEKIIEKILTENNDKVEQYKSGKDKLFGFFVGQVMKISGGKANPQLVNQRLKNKLKK
jgi:aspartyl-tRNA(Asn)/glutamyl-tRNA(Gln) amidotransferase subunit B